MHRSSWLGWVPFKQEDVPHRRNWYDPPFTDRPSDIDYRTSFIVKMSALYQSLIFWPDGCYIGLYIAILSRSQSTMDVFVESWTKYQSSVIRRASFMRSKPQDCVVFARSWRARSRIHQSLPYQRRRHGPNRSGGPQGNHQPEPQAMFLTQP